MLEALVYLFAIYGVGCFLYFNLRHKWQLTPAQCIRDLPDDAVCLVVKVKDAEESIEALIRECVKLGISLDLPHRLVIIDKGSRDQTVEIIKRLTYRYPYLTLASEGQRLGRQVVVEYRSSENPKQVVKTLARSCKQEFST